MLLRKKRKNLLDLTFVVCTFGGNQKKSLLFISFEGVISFLLGEKVVDTIRGDQNKIINVLKVFVVEV